MISSPAGASGHPLDERIWQPKALNS